MPCQGSPNSNTAYLTGWYDKGLEAVKDQAGRSAYCLLNVTHFFILFFLFFILAIVGGVGIGIAFVTVST